MTSNAEDPIGHNSNFIQSKLSDSTESDPLTSPSPHFSDESISESQVNQNSDHSIESASGIGAHVKPIKFNFELKHVKQILKQVTQAIDTIHKTLKAAHRDIKLDNILLCEKYQYLPNNSQQPIQIKLCDFGFVSRVKNEFGDKILSAPSHTPTNIAPEIYHNYKKPRNKICYTEKCDIWSLGVVFYELLFGCHPFHNFDRQENLPLPTAEVTEDMSYCIMNGIISPHMNGICNCHDQDWSVCGESGRDLMMKMFVVDADRRISAEEILQHPFLQDA